MEPETESNVDSTRALMRIAKTLNKKIDKRGTESARTLAKALRSVTKHVDKQAKALQRNILTVDKSADRGFTKVARMFVRLSARCDRLDAKLAKKANAKKAPKGKRKAKK